MSDIAAKLDEARALIEKGWTQHVYVERQGRQACYCLLGAVSKAAVGAPDYEKGLLRSHKKLERAVSPVLRALGCADAFSAAVWNDARGRTQAEVVEVLGRAAELARAESAQ